MKSFVFRKKAMNILMIGLTGLCTLMTGAILFFILGYLVSRGASSLNWAFFTKLPAPVGEIGGNAGVPLLVGIAGLICRRQIARVRHDRFQIAMFGRNLVFEHLVDADDQL